MTNETAVDLAVVGGGAAGLMAAITAARTAAERQAPALTVVVLDGARRLGAKILAAGGGRCNVTHDEVQPGDFAGSSRHAIRKVLLHFGVDETVAFFADLGVELKREETGKLFPVTDKARTVLEALLQAAHDAGVRILNPQRVEKVTRATNGFRLEGEWGSLQARRLVLATGGKSLPSTGSDGQGYALARALGHTLTPKIFPALVPLVLAEGHFIRSLSGLAVPATLEVRSATGKRLAAFTDSTLCTHFGLSGPCALNISRYWIAEKQADPAASLWIRWLPGQSFEAMETQLQNLGDGTPLKLLREKMPERLALALCVEAGVDPRVTGHRLGKKDRRALTRVLDAMLLPVNGDKGFGVAEVTAGGVPLAELNLNTLESLPCPGLHLCGEICDVDGRIGGFNFQWAWASGFTAGKAAARALTQGAGAEGKDYDLG